MITIHIEISKKQHMANPKIHNMGGGGGGGGGTGGMLDHQLPESRS